MCLVFSLEETAKGLSGQTASFFTDKQEKLEYNFEKINSITFVNDTFSGSGNQLYGGRHRIGVRGK